MLARDRVFVSYSHKDRKLFEEFRTMIAPATHSKVDLWSDERIQPGGQWEKEIQNALASARVAVLLVSPHFLASHFIQENELPPLLKAAREHGVGIFWIYLSPCLFEETPIASYQAAHRIPPALNRLSKPIRDEVLQTICRRLVQEVTSHQTPAHTGNSQTGGLDRD
jgi:hypothetical protein